MGKPKGHSLVTVQGAPEDNSVNPKLLKKKKIIQEPCHQPCFLIHKLQDLETRSLLLLPWMGCGWPGTRCLPATDPTRRQNSLFDVGLVSGCFSSLGLLSVFMQIKACFVKCFGPGLEFKMRKGQAWTFIKKKKDHVDPRELGGPQGGSREARCLPAGAPPPPLPRTQSCFAQERGEGS